MKGWLRWLGMGAALVGSAIFVAYLLRTLDIEQLRAHLDARALGGMAAAVLLYMGIVPLGARAWQIILRDMGHRDRFMPLLAIVSATQAGKYLPGNVGQHVGRVGLAIGHGIPAAILIASMAYEICLLLLADLATALGMGAMSGPGLDMLPGGAGHGTRIAIAALAAIVLVAAIPLLGQLLPRIAHRVVSRGGGVHTPTSPLRIPAIAKVLALYVLAMLCVGASMAALALGLFPGGELDFALLTAAFTLAWAVGFVTPGAPAGMGVRETMLLVMLGPGLGAANATLLILALRVATTLGDMLCFVGGMALLPIARLHPLRPGARGKPLSNNDPDNDR